MKKPRICPCTSKIDRTNFFLFIMILDILTQGLGGFICGGLGLVIYCCTRNFNSYYFNIFSIGRFITDIVILILLIILMIRYYKGYDDINYYFHVNTLAKAIPFFVILTLYYIWNIYLSFNFALQVQYYQIEFKEENEIITEEDLPLKFKRQEHLL